MNEPDKLQRIMKRCFEEKEWGWLSQQPNFMKLYSELSTLEEFEALCEVASNMLITMGEHDRESLKLRLRHHREQADREWM